MTLVIPSAPPTEFAAGDTVTFTVAQGVYLSADGWTAQYRVIGTTVAEVAAVANGTDWLITLPASDSADLTVGTARQVLLVSLAGARYTAWQYPVTVTPDLGEADDGDLQTHAERMLAAIEALLEGRATAGMSEYTIGTRRIVNMPAPELVTWRNYYRAEVIKERNGGRLPGILVGRSGQYGRAVPNLNYLWLGV